MRKITILILILAFSTTSFSQIDTTKVSFVAYWSVGDSYDFKVTKIKQQWKEGALTKDESQSYVANFTVIDSTDSSYTISWKYENNLNNAYNIPEELLHRFSKYKLTEIKYKTTELGDLVEILNWQEVSQMMTSMFDDIIEILGENDKSKGDVFATILQPLKDIYSSKEGIEQLVLKELQYFHFPMGLEYDITAPLFYDEELPNMFGGKPIKAKAVLKFEDVDFEENFCVLKQEMILDPKDTKDILKQVFKQMNIADKDFNKAFKTAVFQIEDHNVYEYYYNPGIPHRIETLRETTININNDKGKRIDKTLIELIYTE